MAFNCRMHRRLAPVPVWISEGVATFFETPDPGGRGWKRIGGVNRLDQQPQGCAFRRAEFHRANP
jgi:hypothetical protein